MIDIEDCNLVLRARSSFLVQLHDAVRRNFEVFSSELRIPDSIEDYDTSTSDKVPTMTQMNIIMQKSFV